LSIVELCNTLDYFLTAEKMSCVSLSDMVLSPSLSLYAEKDSVCNFRVCYTKAPKKDSLKGFSLTTLTKDDGIF